MNRTWDVLESEVGSVALCVSENDDVVYIHTGYQHHPSEQLQNDLAALSGKYESGREKDFWHSTLKENRNDIRA